MYMYIISHVTHTLLYPHSFPLCLKTWSQCPSRPISHPVLVAQLLPTWEDGGWLRKELTGNMCKHVYIYILHYIIYIYTYEYYFV